VRPPRLERFDIVDPPEGEERELSRTRSATVSSNELTNMYRTYIVPSTRAVTFQVMRAKRARLEGRGGRCPAEHQKVDQSFSHPARATPVREKKGRRRIATRSSPPPRRRGRATIVPTVSSAPSVVVFRKHSRNPHENSASPVKHGIGGRRSRSSTGLPPALVAAPNGRSMPSSDGNGV